MSGSRRRFLQLSALCASTAAVPVYLFANSTGKPSKPASVAVDIADSAPSTGNNACNSLLSHELRPLMGPERRPLCDDYMGLPSLCSKKSASPATRPIRYISNLPRQPAQRQGGTSINTLLIAPASRWPIILPAHNP